MELGVILPQARINAMTRESLWPNRILLDYLDDAVTRTPDKAAITTYNGETTTTSVNLFDGVWHDILIFMSYDGTTAYCWIDGVLEATHSTYVPAFGGSQTSFGTTGGMYAWNINWNHTFPTTSGHERGYHYQSYYHTGQQFFV